MAIAAVIDLDGVTAERHDALVEAMGLTDQPASAVVGLIFHATGPTPTGWRLIDVWESEDDAARFWAERVVPAAARVGGLPQPRIEIFPVHTMQR